MGLKNVGQTCWFSAVIQSLFYLPVFRNLVLNYVPATPTNGMVEDEKQKKIREFMQELRKLFALMVATQRKYVDPSTAVELLRGTSVGSGGSSGSSGGATNSGGTAAAGSLILADNNQQDVSEFTHIVLEWVEEAFKAPAAAAKEDEVFMMDADADAENEDPNGGEKKTKAAAAPPPRPDAAENPISKLFYGCMEVEGTRNGENFSRKEQFGQFMLQVNKFSELHESLENYTANEKIGGQGEDDPEGLGGGSQEHWFTDLPPLLFFSLLRFEFNPERKHAEKIHSRFDFPEVLYMDRYVSENKEVTRLKRDEVRGLKASKEDLERRLKGFTEYAGSSISFSSSAPSEEKPKVLLPLVLQYALEFAASASSTSSSSAATLAPDVNMASPPDTSRLLKSAPTAAAATSSSLMQVDSPGGSPKMTPSNSISNLPAAAAAASHTKDDSAAALAMDSMDVEMAPPPPDAVAAPPPPPAALPSCDSAPCAAAETAATAPENNNCGGLVDVASVSAMPVPKHVSDVELQVIKVRGQFRYTILSGIYVFGHSN